MRVLLGFLVLCASGCAARPGDSSPVPGATATVAQVCNHPWWEKKPTPARVEEMVDRILDPGAHGEIYLRPDGTMEPPGSHAEAQYRGGWGGIIAIQTEDWHGKDRRQVFGELLHKLEKELQRERYDARWRQKPDKPITLQPVPPKRPPTGPVVTPRPSPPEPPPIIRSAH